MSVAKSSIEWTESTWSPVSGCDRVSPGCDNCYALTMARRLKVMGTDGYQRDGDSVTSGPGFGVSLHSEKVLTAPLRWKKPRKVFVDSMGDLFHADVPDEFIARVFAVMALAPQHTFQLLTKRHARMRSLLSSPRWPEILVGLPQWPNDVDPEQPLPNVWLGVSVEDQHWADIRIPALLNTPAAVRWISAEPLLGPVNLRGGLCGGGLIHGVDWVVAGGESGPGARPMVPSWALSLRDQCQMAGVPFLFKQWGAHDERGRRVGKKTAGRELAGVTHDGYPS